MGHPSPHREGEGAAVHLAQLYNPLATTLDAKDSIYTLETFAPLLLSFPSWEGLELHCHV